MAYRIQCNSLGSHSVVLLYRSVGAEARPSNRLFSTLSTMLGHGGLQLPLDASFQGYVPNPWRPKAVLVEIVQVRRAEEGWVQNGRHTASVSSTILQLRAYPAPSRARLCDSLFSWSKLIPGALEIIPTSGGAKTPGTLHHPPKTKIYNAVSARPGIGYVPSNLNDRKRHHGTGRRCIRQ